MQGYHKRACALLLAVVSTLLFAANRHQDEKKQLDILEKTISQTQSSLKQHKRDRLALNHQLHVLEARIARQHNQTHALQIQLKENRAISAKISRQLAQQRADDKALTHALAMLWRETYKISRYSPLKLVLNWQDPAAMRRNLTYHRLVRQRLASTLQAHEATQKTMRATQAMQRSHNRQLRTQLASLANKTRLIKQDYEQRHTVVQQLNQLIAHDSRRVAHLESNAQQFRRLLSRLSRPATKTAQTTMRSQQFAHHKGLMPWPTMGKIAHRFGTNRNQTSLRYDGIIIAAPLGQAVRAVHTGRVAYADWLRGLGLLIIIDHGDHYMTLYAHNQSLYKSVGDWVKSGEAIATVGVSGGIARPGLYFEIRNNGKPVNPNHWIATK